MKKRPPRNAKPPEAAGRSLKPEPRRQEWELWLYVAGPTPKSAAVFRNLEQICEEHLAGRYRIKVIDLVKNPQIARDEQIVAVPTVVRKHPLPGRRIIGDLSNTERVLAGLDLRTNSTALLDSYLRKIRRRPRIFGVE